jgi:MerR family transcriptional regulator, thiopeptide resistance regulator
MTMLTVTRLARACGLSRSTVLYYESVGLLRPPARTASNYRRYGERDLARMRQILVYRQAGLNLADIRVLLDRPDSDATSLLKRRLVELDAEIAQRRDHQRAIFKLLKSTLTPRKDEMITKDKWVSIMKAAGFTEDDMRRWHAEFEKSAPEEHKEFLEFLHIPAGEITQIREWSRKESRH